jgi:hypothetical protein
VKTSNSNIAIKIKEIPKWEFLLKSFRPDGETAKERRRRYHVKLKPGATLPPEVWAAGELKYEID